ncbi:peptidase family S66 [Favolaschia claudopus]|uniref:Peptidase family S66 n=1 Tax=Favolaschia claudopus TaxID=2862362 RepID=A0AAW0C984_9AGAR
MSSTAIQPILPLALRPGDTIGFVSPSARLNDLLPAFVTRAVQALESLGYTVKIFWTPTTTRLTVSQSISHRLQELHAAFTDPSVRAIVCTFGGANGTELLPYLLNPPPSSESDSQKFITPAIIRANPKIFIGYSDISVLHWWLASQTGLRTFYGPTAIAELGAAPAPMQFTIDNLLRVITNPAPAGPLPRSEHYAPKAPPLFTAPDDTSPPELAPTPKWIWLRNVKGKGRLYGGCLGVVVRMAGVQPIVPADWSKHIVFVETAMAEDLSKGHLLHNVQRNIADLLAQGVLANPAGLVIGRAFGYDSEAERKELERVVREVLCPEVEGEVEGKFSLSHPPYPILMHVDIGHTSPHLTLPFGALASLDSDKDEFAILEAGVCSN